MQKIYAMGVLYISSNSKKLVEQQRLWGIFKSFEDAEKAILENLGDLFEYSYNFALIEEHVLIDYSDDSKEIVPYTPTQWWYQATFPQNQNENSNPIIEKIKQPECMENICNFWIG